MTAQTSFRVSICICTFRREGLLDRLLPMLAQEAAVLMAQASPAVVACDIVVADNDPAHSAKDVLTRQAAQLPLPLRWAHAPQPNIALARNTAIGLATGDWLAFIDDDETPRAGWLLALWRTQVQYQADAVFAPVVATYRPDTPSWMVAGKFFERARFDTGTVLKTSEARTGNVLIRRDVLLAIPGPFDLSFGNTGGEDTHLFRTLADQGARFIWCDEAVVTEEVPADRATLGWLLRRSFRVGQTFLRSEWRAATSGRARVRVAVLLAKAVVQLLVATAMAMVWLPLSRPTSVRWLRVAFAQAGKLSVLVGHEYREYGKPA